jgi:hypothetical protein
MGTRRPGFQSHSCLDFGEFSTEFMGLSVEQTVRQQCGFSSSVQKRAETAQIFAEIVNPVESNEFQTKCGPSQLVKLAEMF